MGGPDGTAGDVGGTFADFAVDVGGGEHELSPAVLVDDADAGADLSVDDDVAVASEDGEGAAVGGEAVDAVDVTVDRQNGAREVAQIVQVLVGIDAPVGDIRESGRAFAAEEGVEVDRSDLSDGDVAVLDVVSGDAAQRAAAEEGVELGVLRGSAAEEAAFTEEAEVAERAVEILPSDDTAGDVAGLPIAAAGEVEGGGVNGAVAEAEGLAFVDRHVLGETLADGKDAGIEGERAAGVVETFAFAADADVVVPVDIGGDLRVADEKGAVLVEGQVAADVEPAGVLGIEAVEDFEAADKAEGDAAVTDDAADSRGIRDIGHLEDRIDGGRVVQGEGRREGGVDVAVDAGAGASGLETALDHAEVRGPRDRIVVAVVQATKHAELEGFDRQEIIAGQAEGGTVGGDAVYVGVGVDDVVAGVDRPEVEIIIRRKPTEIPVVVGRETRSGVGHLQHARPDHVEARSDVVPAVDGTAGTGIDFGAGPRIRIPIDVVIGLRVGRGGHGKRGGGGDEGKLGETAVLVFHRKG